MGRFVIDVKPGNVMFSLHARNGEPIATSLTFPSLSVAKRCVESVRRLAARTDIGLDDCSVRTKDPDAKPVKNPKFELYKDKNGAFRFRLRARNGEIILNSSSYTTKASCKNGIASVIKNAPDAELSILDQ